MTFDEYQDRAATTAKYLEAGEHNRVVYPLLGLAGEVGEVIAAFLGAVWGRVSFNEMNPLEQVVFVALNRVAEPAARCEVLKKQLRKDELSSIMTAECKEQLRRRVEAATAELKPVLTDEVADGSLWYASQLLRDLGVKFSTAAEDNLAKLAVRAANGQIVERIA